MRTTDFISGQFVSDAPRLGTLIPEWSWQTWLLISLGLLLCFIFEVVYRRYGKLDVLTKLIKEGERLLPLIVQQGTSEPKDALNKYHARVVRDLRRWFGNGYDREWDEYINTAKPRVPSTELSTTSRYHSWNQVSAGLDWLRDFRLKQS